MNSETAPPSSDTSTPTVLVGVGAGIAAYKVAYLVRGLRKAGCAVIVAPTDSSLEFVGQQTWQELSENPVARDIFHAPDGVGHIELARRADLIIVAPCTADLASQLRAGNAGNLLAAAILASSAPKLLVPAMHTNMWLNPATVENFAVLRERGFAVLEPARGALSSGDQGIGRMPEPEQILEHSLAMLSDQSLRGQRIIVTAGGTIESIDPVRYLGNHSSGRQGVELARVAALRGADVTLVVGQTQVPLPVSVPGITVVHAPSAMQMQTEIETRLATTDVLIMAAAVADYRPVEASTDKLKKDAWGDEPILRLVRNPDILRGIADSPHRPAVLVGFAAETGSDEDIRTFGAKKARSKGADYIAVNRVGHGHGFGEVDNELWVLDATGAEVATVRGSKRELAEGLLSLVVGTRR